MNHSEITSFIWGVADLIRDTFKRGKYQDVILPMTVLRRIDCVLEPTKEKVLEKYREFKDRGATNIDPILRTASGFAFYNTSKFTFDKLVEDPPNIAHNLRAYINGFSENMREVLEKFDFDRTLTKLDESNLLYLVVQKFNDDKVDLHPDRVDNHTMGLIFEDLIRRFNEATNENPGEHFTPRDVVRLMARLMLDPDSEELSRPGIVKTVYDPCCGTGGMLTVTRDLVRERNPEGEIVLFGQEVNPETFAICKSDLFLKTRDGRDAENILYGSVLSNDRHAGVPFDYLIANPPYGKDWKMDKESVTREHKSDVGRFEPGLPRISDGQTLFLLHMVHHMKSLEKGGSRMGIIMNGSPLFTGDAGSGESEIRRWLMENDLVDALIALPEQLFYNTGIATYVWVLTNRKDPARKGKVQLIDASGEDFWRPMRKSLGDKRRELSPEHIEEIVAIYRAFEESDRSKIFPTTAFGYRKIRVERPLRLAFRFTPERIERLEDERAFGNLAKSRKKGDAGKKEREEGQALQQTILRVLRDQAEVDDTRYTSRRTFRKAIKETLEEADLSLRKPVRNAIESALGERDEEAEICKKKGEPEPDTDLRDYETVPLGEDVNEYFEREVLPHVPDAWVAEDYTDEKDGGIGRVGYEINFNRYFYVYTPPRPLKEIEADIRVLEREIVEMIQDVAG